ncbi:MAG: HXXEE domain-containing protein [Pseudomonadota bacterium]
MSRDWAESQKTVISNELARWPFSRDKAEHMSSSKAPVGFLIVAFLMLWLPLGQHQFLYDHWMKVGTFMAPFLLFLAFAWRTIDTPLDTDTKLLSALMLVFYIIHQFEEHWIDVFGNIYAFQGYLNTTLRSNLGSADPSINLITKADIFVINTSLVWLAACIAIFNAPKNLFPALCIVGIIFINALSHIVSSLRDLHYNPGLVTSVLIFLPFALWFYRAAVKRQVASRKHILLGLGWALIGHVILIAGLIMKNHLGYISPTGYYAALLIWSVVPLTVDVPGSDKAD